MSTKEDKVSPKEVQTHWLLAGDHPESLVQRNATYRQIWREAYNAAIDEAAQWCEQEDIEHDPDDLYTGRVHRAAAIRALKRDGE